MLIGLVFLASCASTRTDSDLSSFAGTWEAPRSFDYTVIKIAKSGEIEWASGGCLDDESGQTRGAYRNQTITLAWPMFEYPGFEIHTLHYIKVNNREYLVPDREMEMVKTEDTPFGSDSWLGLRRRVLRTELLHRQNRTQNKTTGAAEP